MGVRTTDKDAVALYDSVTGFAFGPVFSDQGEADDFLEWYGGAKDLRTLQPETLEVAVSVFRRERGES